MLYESKEGQNIYDVCLQTYGILDYLLKLITENNLDSIGTQFKHKIFTFDEDLIVDYALFNKITSEKINYLTGMQLQGLLTDSGIQIQTDDGQDIFID